MAKLTVTDIKNLYYLKEHPKPLQIKLDTPNLYLWVTKKGRCTFRFKFYRKGVCTWSTIGHFPAFNINEATKSATILQSKRDVGINPNIEKKELEVKSITLAEFLDTFESTNTIRDLSKNTIKNQGYILSNIKEAIGSYTLQNITGDIIYNKLIKQYVDNDKRSMAEKYRLKLKQVFNYAIKKEIIFRNPTNSLDTYYENKNSLENNLTLTENELKEFINSLYNDNNIPNRCKYYIHLLMMLGVRKNELYNATWDDIDFEKAIFANYQTKTKNLNLIPLTKQAIKILTVLKNTNTTSKYIITNSVNMNNDCLVSHQYFNKLLNRTKFNKARDLQHRITPHDFRRVLSTIANDSEKFYSQHVDMVLGHETRESSEKHYNKATSNLSRKREVLEFVANKIDELINDDIDVYNLVVFP